MDVVTGSAINLAADLVSLDEVSSSVSVEVLLYIVIFELGVVLLMMFMRRK